MPSAPFEPPPLPLEDSTDPKLQAVAGGVSLNWLKIIFRKPLETVRARLRGCKPLRTARGGARYYDIAEAASFLVDPKTDIETFIKTVRPSDLPANLLAATWEAKLKRQKFEKNAGDLWPTHIVLGKLADAFKLIRVTMQLWVDDLDRFGLSPQQREHLTKGVDSLQNDLYVMLVEKARQTSTRSQLAELDEPAAAADEDEPEERSWV